MLENIDYALAKMGPVLQDPATPKNIVDWLTDIGTALAAALQPSARLLKGSALAETTGGLADQYAEVRAARLELQKLSERVKERESELYKMILANLEASPDTGAAGHNYRVQLVSKTRNNVKDWPTLHAHIQKTGDFEMLQKRLADKAVAEYAETNEGRMPPGVEPVEVATLSFSKV